MARVEVSRHVEADPASVALLLAEPPGEPDRDSGVVVSPPRRTAVGFAAGVQITTLDAGAAIGEITVEPAVDAGADLLLTAMAPDGAAGRAVEHTATSYLARLASRARSRSFAA
jgi:hypothetical protein